MTGSDVGIRYEAEGITFVKSRIGSTELAEQDIGFRAKVGLLDGMRELVEWRRADQEQLRVRREQASAAST